MYTGVDLKVTITVVGSDMRNPSSNLRHLYFILC